MKLVHHIISRVFAAKFKKDLILLRNQWVLNCPPFFHHMIQLLERNRFLGINYIAAYSQTNVKSAQLKELTVNLELELKSTQHFGR